MKKLLLSVLFACTLISTTSKSEVPEICGGGLGYVIGDQSGEHLDQSLAKKSFDSLRKKYPNNPKMLEKITKLEVLRHFKLTPRRVFLRITGIASGALIGSIVTYAITDSLRSKSITVDNYRNKTSSVRKTIF